MISGCLFDIKRYAVHDGPGIRLSLFFKGCPLRCAWCHNPESQLAAPEILYTASQCIGCHSCHNRTRPEECPSGALEWCGRTYTLPEIMEEIEKERIFFEHSGGGVTFTGGEPLLQPRLLLPLLEACEARNIHRAVDTCLYAPTSLVERVIPHTSLFLIDIKIANPALHKQYTGVDNALIWQNARLVAASGVPFWIRVPYIGGVNDSSQERHAIQSFIDELRTLATPSGAEGTAGSSSGAGTAGTSWAAGAASASGAAGTSEVAGTASTSCAAGAASASGAAGTSSRLERVEILPYHNYGLAKRARQLHIYRSAQPEAAAPSQTEDQIWAYPFYAPTIPWDAP